MPYYCTKITLQCIINIPKSARIYYHVCIYLYVCIYVCIRTWYCRGHIVSPAFPFGLKRPNSLGKIIARKKHKNNLPDLRASAPSTTQVILHEGCQQVSKYITKNTTQEIPVYKPKTTRRAAKSYKRKFQCFRHRPGNSTFFFARTPFSCGIGTK